MSTLAAERPSDLTADNRHKAIVFDEVSIEFDGDVVLDRVSFSLDRGATKAVFGVAGSGKTTLLKLALGLVRPDSGHIYVLGYDVTAMREEELFELRRKVGMVFQESALFDSLKVKENVAFRLIEEGDVPEDELERRVREALRFVELEQTLEMLPGELSGGMRRRVAIARAIITQPEVLLYDSPTAGLDPLTSTKIIELLVKQRDVYRSSALLVSHRLQDAFIMASHYFDLEKNEMRPLREAPGREVHTSFVILREGKVIFDGTAAQLADTDDEYIKEYIS